MCLSLCWRSVRNKTMMPCLKLLQKLDFLLTFSFLNGTMNRYDSTIHLPIGVEKSSCAGIAQLLNLGLRSAKVQLSNGIIYF